MKNYNALHLKPVIFLKGKILREHILEDKNLEDIAIETRYSVSYIYAQKLKILKEFAAMVFEVIIL